MSTALLRLKYLSARNIAIASIALSGAVHLLIVPEQISHSAAHGSFFAFLGVAQLLWALYFRWRPAAPLYWTGVLLSGGIVITWLLAFFVSTPFSAHVVPIDAYLLASKILELIGLHALITYGAAEAVARADQSSISRLVANSLVASVIFGAMVWGGGELAELLPSGSEDGPALGSGQSHSEGRLLDHESVETHPLESVQANLTADFQPTPDIQAITNAAVEAALGALEENKLSADSSAGGSNTTVDSAKSPSPVLPSDIQAMIAVAVEAALNPDLALMPTPDPLPGHQGMVTAAAVGSTTAPAPIAQATQRTESAASLLPGEEKLDLQMLLFGTALVALTLVAVVGAVRTWNDITLS